MKQEMTPSRRSWPWWRWVITGLSALAFALSAYLGWHYLLGGSVIGCGGGSPCDKVLSSRWAAIGVLPVSGLAAGTYLALLVASLSIGPATAAPVRQLAWRAMLVLAGAAAGSAIWFIILQMWVIGAFCPYCTATHITGLLLAALIMWQAPRQVEKSQIRKFCRTPVTSGTPSNFKEAGFCVLRWFRISYFGVRIWPVVGLALAGLLAVCQVGITPPAVAYGGESQPHVATIDPHTVPLVGSPDAPYVVKLLLDYTCPHCQQLHFMLDEAIRRYGGKLAFALCPTPLNSQCNPHVLRDVDEFKDACDLAKVGLAVWLAKREAFPAFDRWMFSLDSGDRWQPRSVDAARAKAVELVGRANFDSAWTNSWIDRHLQTSVRLFADTGSNAIPKLVFGSRWVIPAPQDADGLVSILHKSLFVPSP